MNKFLMVIETKDENKSMIEALLKNGGASEISFK